MTDLTSTAKKIMDIYRYFRLKKGDYLSRKLLMSRQYLWQDIEEEQFNEAVEDLVGLGYIEKLEILAGWRLLELGAEYIKGLERR